MNAPGMLFTVELSECCVNERKMRVALVETVGAQKGAWIYRSSHGCPLKDNESQAKRPSPRMASW
jgi:hypothetical protein